MLSIELHLASIDSIVGSTTPEQEEFNFFVGPRGYVIDSSRPQRTREFLAGRLLLRQALARKWSLDINAISIGLGADSMPVVLSDTVGKNVVHNLAHSGDVLVCALASVPEGDQSEVRIGVDCEVIKVRKSMNALAQRIMTMQEFAQYTALQDPSEYFYWCWTRKEACAKRERASVWDLARFDAFESNERLDSWTYRNSVLSITCNQPYRLKTSYAYGAPGAQNRKIYRLTRAEW